MLIPTFAIFCLLTPLFQRDEPVLSTTVTTTKNSPYTKIFLRHCTAKDLALTLGISFIPPQLIPSLLPDSYGYAKTMLPNGGVRSLRPPGVDNIIALGDGSLLVQGDPADVEELQALIHALDVPIPSVECRLDVVRGKQKVLSASVAGKAGTVVKATNALVGSATKAARIEATFKILPLGVGRYEIESQGKLSVPLAKRGMRLEKTFQSTRELALGETLTLERTELNGEVVSLTLSLKNLSLKH